ncbi:hypothetical protein N7540_010789 [Penicillium herquei]|nr:hypothetical protein N7540_010789 [Penicillium herquei]
MAPASRSTAPQSLARVPMYNLWAQEELGLGEADQNDERVGVIDLLEEHEIENGFSHLRPGYMTREWGWKMHEFARANRWPATMNANILNDETRNSTLEALRKLWRQWRKGQRPRGLQKEGLDPQQYRNIAGTVPYKRMRLLWILNRRDRSDVISETIALSRLAGLSPEPLLTADAAADNGPPVDDGPPPGYDTAHVGYDPLFPVDPTLMLDPAAESQLEALGVRTTSTFTYENDDLIWNAPVMVVIPNPTNIADAGLYDFQSCNLSEIMPEDSPLNPNYKKNDYKSFDDMWLDYKALQITTMSNRLLQIGAMTEEGSLWWTFRPASQWRLMLQNENDRTPIGNDERFREIVRHTYQQLFPWYYGRRGRSRGDIPNGPRPCFTIFVVPSSQGKSIQ